MEAPTCKYCGKNHWERVCPSLAVSMTKQGKSTSFTEHLSIAPVKGSDFLHNPHLEPLHKFDKTAYQREYMRKRRAKEREAKG